LRLLRELRSTLGQMRMGTPAVGSDRRNRWMLSPFSSKTGRNQPSSRDFIFARASWNRGFIRPEPGFALAYLDWSQQEFGIAAALSDDGNMIAAYNSGDPYLGTAKQTGAVPLDATKQSHGEIRDLYKKVVLGVQYSMGEEGLARRIGKSLAHARELLQMHRKTYRRFWKWSDDALQYAMIHNSLYTTFGWTIHVGPDTNPRTLRNFLMQGNGAEMLRLAWGLATERGIAVCAPVHDAVLIEAPLDGIDHAVLEAQEAMADASAFVLDGFRLRTDARVIRYPDCLVEERGMHMWKLVWETLSELKLESGFPWSR
jgi:DNA polymerase-1